MSAPAQQSVPDKICIVMMSAVGDAVHVLPVINALKRANPKTRISWVLQPGPAALVRNHRSVDEIIAFDRTLEGRTGVLKYYDTVARFRSWLCTKSP